MNEVWVVAEQRSGRLLNVSLELLGKGAELARKLDAKLGAVLMGEHVSQLAGQLFSCGAEKVYLQEDARLRLYQSELYAHVLTRSIEKEHPQIVLVGATSIGQEIAAGVAARLGTGLTAHCVDLAIDECQGKPLLTGVVPGWGGSLMVRIVCPDKKPQMATVNPGALPRAARDESRIGQIIPLQIDLNINVRCETLEMGEEAAPSGISLENADRVVAGGWGLSSAGNFTLVEALAEVLGAAVAGTRPAVDSGWITEKTMIGQSGRIVSPTLFVSIGASGAPQFTSGFARSKVILSVDQNRNAPIFNAADLGLVGDLQEIVPCLIEALKASKIEP